MRRAKYTEKLPVMFTPWQRNELSKAAKAKGMSCSRVVRIALGKYLSGEDQDGGAGDQTKDDSMKVVKLNPGAVVNPSFDIAWDKLNEFGGEIYCLRRDQKDHGKLVLLPEQDANFHTLVIFRELEAMFNDSADVRDKVYEALFGMGTLYCEMSQCASLTTTELPDCS